MRTLVSRNSMVPFILTSDLDPSSSFTEGRKKKRNLICSAATAATPLQSDPQLTWTIETFFQDVFDQIVFECNVNTTGLDPNQDLLDVTFKIGETVMKAYTELPYGNLPARLEGMKDFSHVYENTEDRKLAYFKTVRVLLHINSNLHIVNSTIK